MIGTRWLFVGLLAVACRPDEFPGLVVTTSLPVGDEECPEGGTRVDAGADDGDPGGTAGDGILQDAEIDDSAFACATTGEHAVLSVTTALPVGDGTCAHGGTHVDFGTDDGDPGGTPDDGILQDAEIDGSEDLCFDEPDAMLSVVTVLPLGDDDCPFGGTRLESGLDDGDPAGTADDGVLAADEIDRVDLACAIDPSEVFATPTPGPAGTNRIDVSGGAGADGASAASGGYIGLAVFGGPLPSAIFLQEAGALDTTAPAANPVVDLGSNGLEITTSTTLSLWDEGGSAPTTPHLRYAAGGLGEVWVGDTQVTGLHVHAGATLTIDTDFLVEGLLLAADLHNEGTIAAGVSGNQADDLALWCDDFVNEGVIGTGASLYSGDLAVQATAIWQLGTVTVAGVDAADAGNPGTLFLVADHDVRISGTVDATGGSGTNESTPGGEVVVIAFDGGITVDGTIDASGATGVHPTRGGMVRLLTSPSADDLDAGSTEDVVEPRPTGPGSYLQSGTIRADGGNSASDDGGDDGGSVAIWVQGGPITLGGLLSAHGGDGGSGASGGGGGQISVSATALVGIGSVELPGPVQIDASLLAQGGAPGGAGGYVSLQVYGNQETGVAGEPVPLGGISGTASLTLVGFGDGIAADGGAAPSTNAGEGGWIEIQNSVCPDTSEEAACSTPDSGARWIWSDVDLSARGGDSGSSSGGGGGLLDVRMTSDGDALHADSDVGRFESHGLLDVGGGDADTSNGGGGDMQLEVEAGEIVLAGDVVASSGRGAGGDGAGGWVMVTAFVVTQSGTLDLRGAGQGKAGSVYFEGWTVTSSGPILADSRDVPSDDSGGGGGEVNVSASGTVVLGGPLSLGGSPGAAGQNHGRGGTLTVIGGTIDLHADVEASAPSSASCAPSEGGYVWLEAATSIAVDADLALDGSSCGDGPGGRGGYLHLLAPSVTTEGTWTLRGGDSGATDGLAGEGGDITITGDNGADITATGGDATGGGDPTGGRGGLIDIAGDNTGCLDISPGNPGGAPGALTIGGTDLSVCN